jgi:hypothetical protein
MVFSRHGDEWAVSVLTETDVLRMPEISVELAVAEIYADVEFGDIEQPVA